MKRALIFGITGQDGSYLSDLLLDKGYAVHGVIRRISAPTISRLSPATWDNVCFHYGDLTDQASIDQAIAASEPDEIYNLAAMSDVKISFDVPMSSLDMTGAGTLRILEAIRKLNIPARYYQASSSEMFGSSCPPQDELTPFHPRSPYACAKVFAYHTAVNYREAYAMHASNGILFNHESPRRGENFVTRKITKAVAHIWQGKQKFLLLGNLNARRDWGFAGDYVEAMWRIVQQSESDDYVIATGEAHTVREFADLAFQTVGLDYLDFVKSDPKMFRPTEVDFLQGDPTKARQVLGWQPKVSFKGLVQMMVDYDLTHE